MPESPPPSYSPRRPPPPYEEQNNRNAKKVSPGVMVTKKDEHFVEVCWKMGKEKKKPSKKVLHEKACEVLSALPSFFLLFLTIWPLMLFALYKSLGSLVGGLLGDNKLIVGADSGNRQLELWAWCVLFCWLNMLCLGVATFWKVRNLKIALEE